MKILITGGLGYIGTELCKIYSGETRVHEITVLDNRFLPERVAQLRFWGINFVHGSILDKELISQLISSDTDIVIHLAGITDVAYVKTEANSEQDILIRKVAIEGTNNIIDTIENFPKIRLIFPSTHVVFEGIPGIKFNIQEDEPVIPVLAYGQSKAQNEQDIIARCKNYVILRLGSAYGLSSDSMRMNIMPNLFAKIASLNGEIKLFSRGLQHKSFVHIIDVARALKFFAEETKWLNQIFHVSRENLTVKDVANICKLYSPFVFIVETNDPVPNLGYTLDNKKLLKTGFNFLYNINISIKEMIEKWSPQPPKRFNEKIVLKTNPYQDERGLISNYKLSESINLVGVITSKAGSVRANHFHPVQEQKCLLIKGRFVSSTLDMLDPLAIIQHQVVEAGNLSIIPPYIAHAMTFLEDSIFINLVNGEREHENFGITHTIPFPLVNPALAAKLKKKYELHDH